MVRSFLVNNKPGSSNRISTSFFELHMLSKDPFIFIQSKSDAYRTSKYKNSYFLMVKDSNSIIDLERSSFLDLREKGIKELSYLKHTYKINDKIFEVCMYTNIPDLIIASVEDNNEELVLPTWIGEEITGNNKYDERNLIINC